MTARLWLITVDRENKEMFSIPDAVLNASLQTLSSLLHKHYGQKPIILIDEYDVPLAKASEHCLLYTSDAADD